MIVAEIGLNHLGNKKYALEYIKKLIKTEIDAITFQVRENSFYKKKKFSHLNLELSSYKKFRDMIKKSGKKFGIAIADENLVDFFNKLDIDFYKILSKDIKNESLLKKVVKSKKKIFISTGMSNENDIKKLLLTLNPYKSKLTLIHTYLNYNMKDINLRAIVRLQEKIKIPIAYGHHSINPNVLFLAIAFRPSDFFFYVKENKKCIDEKHAIKLSDVSYIINNLKQLYAALGSGNKKRMNNSIEQK